MATEQQHFQESVQVVPTIEKWKCDSTLDTTNDNISSGFDCNICLDTVHDPVVTLCGHLYCWPCIYKWLHFQTTTTTDHKSPPPQPQCPVCKAEVSNTTLVPLYGRGQTTKPPSETKAANLGLVIPRRPPSPSCGVRTLSTTPINYRPVPQLHQAPIHHRNHLPTLNIANPMGGMFGEMVYARVFGNPESDLFASVYPNSYHLTGSSSPRVRRHVMEADKSLSRICFFLFCCMVLCLLVF